MLLKLGDRLIPGHLASWPAGQVCRLAMRRARSSPGTVKELPEELAREAHDWTLSPQRSRANFAYYARSALLRHADVLTN